MFLDSVLKYFTLLLYSVTNELYNVDAWVLSKKMIDITKKFQVEGHRSDIINDVDKLIQYIRGDKDNITSGKTKSNLHKSKQLKQHSEDNVSQKKKQRAHSSRSKEGRSELKKSNSLGEISTTKLDNFAFAEKEENKVVLRNGKVAQTDRPKERRSWGNVDVSKIYTLIEISKYIVPNKPLSECKI